MARPRWMPPGDLALGRALAALARRDTMLNLLHRVRGLRWRHIVSSVYRSLGRRDRRDPRQSFLKSHKTRITAYGWLSFREANHLACVPLLALRVEIPQEAVDRSNNVRINLAFPEKSFVLIDSPSSSYLRSNCNEVLRFSWVVSLQPSGS